MRPIVFLSQTGCLLPVLIFFNLLFGWLFFRPLIWLGIGVFLILLFIINATIVTKKVFSGVSRDTSKVIDIEAEVVDEALINH